MREAEEKAQKEREGERERYKENIILLYVFTQKQAPLCSIRLNAKGIELKGFFSLMPF